jgi:SH3-like domain-containing protein
MVIFLSGCGLLFGNEPEATPEAAEMRALVPTFTSTPVAAVQPSPTEALPAAPPTNTPVPTAVVTTTTSITATTGTTTSASLTATTTLTTTTVTTTGTGTTARLTVDQDLVNMRLGPGTDYGLAGEATKGQAFDVIGKNQQGDWWQICCVNGQEAWVFGQLARVENGADIPVVTNLPPKPVAQAPTAAPQPQAQPTPAPAPQEPAPPAAGDPCANIGGDGCKFKVRNGPKFNANGGNELKLQFMFMHSGDGGRPQGSYFVAMFKDGQKLPISDAVRSQIDVRQPSPLGEYNYEYKVNTSSIPGNNVAGTYVLHVLDGNGERDSRDITINVPEGQGEIWLEFDQG